MNYLIIEDNPLEIDAIPRLIPNPAKIVSTFSEARSLLETQNYDGVLSDLFFPFGESNEFLDESEFRKYAGTLYTQYMSRIKPEFLEGLPRATNLEEFFLYQKEGVLPETLRAIKNALNVKGSIFEKLDEVDKEKFPGDVGFITKLLEQNGGHKFKQYLFGCEIEDHRDEVLARTHDAPLGIAIYQACKEKNIPCVIVTGDYHHGPKFQALCEHAGPSVDIVDKETNLKAWKSGYERLEHMVKNTSSSYY